MLELDWGRYVNDLLPLPYTEEALGHVAARVSEVQEILGRRILVENVSSYLEYLESSIPEWEFLREVAQRSGCGILLDVNNIYVSARNHGFDPRQYLLSIPGGLLRLWLAHGFWISGVLKVAQWDTALTLATYLGVAIEIACPILLILGLATRLAAIPFLLLSLVIQFEYKLLNEHVYWVVLFGWYALMGAGPLSLDRMLAAGFADSAVPFARALSRGVAVFRRWVGPLYQLALRAWLAVILATPSLPVLSAVALFGYRHPVTLLPPGSPAYLGVVLGVLGLILVPGLGTRLFAAVAVLILFSQTGSQNLDELTRIDYLYCMLLLGLVMLQGAGPLSLNHGLAQALRRRFPQLQGKPAAPLDRLPQVIIVGAGFGVCARPRACAMRPAGSRSWMRTITICFSRCCIRWLPPAFPRRCRGAHPRIVSRPVQCAGTAREGHRSGPRDPGRGPRRRPATFL